ncbi:MAG: preprotein translocase subunit SecD [Haloarculaceae archaeon]
MSIRENWRIGLLVVLVLVSAVVLFVPGSPPGASASDFNGTNLQYGIQLSGGARIEAPVVGITAEGVNVTANDSTNLEQALTHRLSLDQLDIRVSAASRTVEVFTDNVSAADLRSALQAEGYDPETVREGVTAATRQDVVEVVRQRISESALSGGSVNIIQTPGGDHFVRIEAPGRGIDELKSLLEERGIVRVYAFYPAGNGTHVREQVLSGDEIDAGTARNPQNQPPGVPVTLTESAARRLQQRMTELGYGQGTSCTGFDRQNFTTSNPSDRCMVATLNGDVVFSGGVEPALGSSFADGSFVDDPTFTMTTTSIQQAQELEVSLKSGSLPAPLDFQHDRESSLQPALANQFRANSVIVGLVAVLAVSLVVYLRYGDLRVAAPMIVTALSEVFLLLGFVSFVQYPLNLSHIAGFIAVIGTGVDDLVIIADEILQREEVTTGRVFQNRFRKAFWVIGGAAATTVIAMSPLTVLALGDLSGFAIVTIVGVLIGVLVTRPAYGDILQHLMVE